MPQEMQEAEAGARQGTVVLPREVQRTLLWDVWNRRHVEACGLLRGSIDAEGNWQVTAAHPLRNIAESPFYFEFAPEEVLQLELAYPGQIIGVYHSHPQGPYGASRTDCETMRRVNQEEQIPWIWLILCGPWTSSPHGAETRADDPVAEAERCGWLRQHLLAYYHDPGQGLRQVAVVLQGEEGRSR
ncbi:Mov34/MPN/PAD-1 family protein [Thermogemmatispora sp.]|uniref:Mov34/MPN/PAD-1 family protein n=1 Tax=Thermogemmatispora sp. TaxID=1968838 RepID=UPI001D28DE94|nr:Mov34/MPN/PAD-1 family protein [Thermogemmatispora sp.]MBX5451469.1 Mov34/MPN/PAD-1 family protein [Thermogemmatispora sp.]